MTDRPSMAGYTWDLLVDGRGQHRCLGEIHQQSGGLFGDTRFLRAGQLSMFLPFRLGLVTVGNDSEGACPPRPL